MMVIVNAGSFSKDSSLTIQSTSPVVICYLVAVDCRELRLVIHARVGMAVRLVSQTGFIQATKARIGT